MTRVVLDEAALHAFVDEHMPVVLKETGDRVAERAAQLAPRSQNPGKHGHAADGIRATEPERDGEDWLCKVGPDKDGFYLTILEVEGHPHLRPALDEVVGESRR